MIKLTISLLHGAYYFACLFIHSFRYLFIHFFYLFFKLYPQTHIQKPLTYSIYENVKITSKYISNILTFLLNHRFSSSEV